MYQKQRIFCRKQQENFEAAAWNWATGKTAWDSAQIKSIFVVLWRVRDGFFVNNAERLLVSVDACDLHTIIPEKESWHILSTVISSADVKKRNVGRCGRNTLGNFKNYVVQEFY